MAFTFNNTLRTARATDIINEAGTGAKLQVYAGSEGVYTTKLAEWTWSGNVWTESGGVLTMLAPVNGGNVTPIATGTAGIARLCKSNGTTVVIGSLSVGTVVGNVILSSLSITYFSVYLISFTISEA